MALRTVTAEEEGLAQAIAETEGEIFNEASGTEPLDNDGDKSLEEMGDGLEGESEDDNGEAGADEDEAGEEEVEAKADTESEPEPAESEPQEPTRDDRGRFVPPGRLREESDRRREAEAQATAKDAELSALRREFEALKAGITQRPAQTQQEAKAAEPPDMFADPEGFRRHVINEANQAAIKLHAEASMLDAAETHGDRFQAAYAEAQRIGMSEHSQFGNSPTVARILSSPNPGKALMSWHAQQATLREVGSDPQAYRERLKQELLNDPDYQAQVIERARGSARQNGARTYQDTSRRLPPSLNTQTGASHHADDPELLNPSERSVFDFATR